MTVDAERKPRRALDSSLESQMSYWRLFLLLGGSLVVGLWLFNFLFTPQMAGLRAPKAVEPIVVTATPTPAPTEAPATFAAVLPLLPSPSPTPIIIVKEVRVTVEPEYIRIPVEGPERVVEVTATPTATPALGPGTVRVCVWMAGVSEVFIGQQGVVPGGCREYVVGVGSSYIEVQVNR